MNLLQEQEFLKGYQDGSVSADEVYTQYYRLVHFFIYRGGVPQDIVEDCTQECMFAMLNIAKQYKLERNLRFSTFLLSQLRGIRTDFKRRYARDTKRNRSLDCMMDEKGFDIADGDDESMLEFRDQFRVAVSSLTKQEKRIIILHYFKDKNLSEIATILGLKNKQAAQRLEISALGKMRLILGKTTEEFDDLFVGI